MSDPRVCLALECDQLDDPVIGGFEHGRGVVLFGDAHELILGDFATGENARG